MAIPWILGGAAVLIAGAIAAARSDDDSSENKSSSEGGSEKSTSSETDDVKKEPSKREVKNAEIKQRKQSFRLIEKRYKEEALNFGNESLNYLDSVVYFSSSNGKLMPKTLENMANENPGDSDSMRERLDADYNLVEKTVENLLLFEHVFDGQLQADQKLLELSQEIERLGQRENDLSVLIARKTEEYEYLEEQLQQGLQNNLELLNQQSEKLRNDLKNIDKDGIAITVVGTMKAGKSTLINAIVGQEILPNRNSAMTTLPTLIKHNPSQRMPVLFFDKQQQIEIQRLIKVAQQKIQTPTYAGKVEASLQDIAKKVMADLSFQTSYQGKEEIFKFLYELNDLVRLLHKLDEPFPYEEYIKNNQWPRIEVAFANLPQAMTSISDIPFSLLDMPGFNEDGLSDSLLDLLQKQLINATSVLAVLNLNQLGSQEDAKFREQLKLITQYSGDRVLFFANQADRLLANDGDIESVKSVLLEKLQAENIDLQEEKLVLGSALYAYLAGAAIHEVSENKQLVRSEDKKWIEDFGTLAFKTFYEEYINDSEMVLKAADQMLAKWGLAPLLSMMSKSLDMKSDIDLNVKMVSKFERSYKRLMA